jgi:hypothetical protein
MSSSSSTFSEQLQVFTRRGEFVRNVNLQSDIKDVWQAIQLDDDRYVVVHGVGSEVVVQVFIECVLSTAMEQSFSRMEEIKDQASDN